jgi:hypothetical protein
MEDAGRHNVAKMEVAQEEETGWSSTMRDQDAVIWKVSGSDLAVKTSTLSKSNLSADNTSEALQKITEPEMAVLRIRVELHRGNHRSSLKPINSHLLHL